MNSFALMSNAMIDLIVDDLVDSRNLKKSAVRDMFKSKPESEFYRWLEQA
jgi:hypothetical protein